MLILITHFGIWKWISSPGFPFALDKICTKVSHCESILVDVMLRLFITLCCGELLKTSYYLEDYENLYPALSEIAWRSVKLQALLGRIPSATARTKRMTHLLLVLGTTRSKSTCSGNSWAVGQTVVTSAWCREKVNASHLVWTLLNIMENGRSYVFLSSRYVLCWNDPQWNCYLYIALVFVDISVNFDILRQEPLSAALSAVNLLMHFTGWLSFFLLVKYKLPLRPQTKRTYYEYTSLWHIYAILSMNAWFWSSIFHTRYELL